VATGTPGPQVQDAPEVCSFKAQGTLRCLRAASCYLPRGHRVEDLCRSFSCECGIQRLRSAECVLGVPAVHECLQRAASLPESNRVGWMEGPRASGRVSVQNLDQRRGRFLEPLQQLSRIAGAGAAE
jgi:hypothetical protein